MLDLEASGCQDEVTLVVNLSIRGVPDCCSRQLVGVESVRMYTRLCRLLFANSRSRNPLSFFSPVHTLPTVPAQCWYASGTTLHSDYFLLGSLCYDAIKLLVKLFDLLIVMVGGWCIDLNDCGVQCSRCNPDIN